MENLAETQPARTDTERINWLAKTSVGKLVTIETSCFSDAAAIWTENSPDEDEPDFSGDDLRYAIDAAMEAADA